MVLGNSRGLRILFGLPESLLIADFTLPIDFRRLKTKTMFFCYILQLPEKESKNE